MMGMCVYMFANWRFVWSGYLCGGACMLGVEGFHVGMCPYSRGDFWSLTVFLLSLLK